MENPTPARRAAFIFVFITVVLDMLALGIMVPVLPKLIVEFEGGNHALAAEITGWFGFAWAAMQFIGSPILGSLADRFGRRPVLLLSSAGLGADYLLMALAPNLHWLFVGRLLSGITAATFSTASAYIADITPPEQRAGKFGMLGAAFGLGFIVGPAIGGLLGHVSLRLPFWVAAGCSLLNTAYGFFVLPESLPLDKRAPFRWNVANPLGAFKFAASSPLLIGLTLSSFCYNLAHESLPSMFVLYTDYKFHWDEKTVGLVLGAVGLSTMFVSAFLTRIAVAKLGETRTLLLGTMFGAIGFFCYGIADQPSIFLLGLPFIGLAGLTGPSLQSLMSARVDETQQGQMQGALSSLRGVGGMIGPLLFTQSFSRATSGSGLPVGIPYFLACALVVCSFFLAAYSISKRSAR